MYWFAQGDKSVWLGRWLLLAVIGLALSGCGGHIYHKIEAGETLYSIGWRYGYDYKTIAKWNNIPPPYIISRGQIIRVAPPSSDGKGDRHVTKTQQAASNKESSTAAVKNSEVTKPDVKVKGGWQWPTDGKVITTFSARSDVRKGIDISGKEGQKIIAASSGRVVYSGSGLVGYGQLIIIKHNQTYLSAYAHNKRLLVKEGDSVKAGQVIAEMGSSGTAASSPMLHFEIRRNGKPVNPLKFLPSRK